MSIVRRRFTRKAFFNDLVTVSITIALTLIMAIFIFSFASRNSIPGDLLYSVKRISENVRLSFIFDQNSRETLENNFHRERLIEIEELMRQNRAAVVEFTGTLDTKGENLWVIEGVTIFLPEEGLTIQGNPQEGDRVEVVGFLRTDTVLVADRIVKAEINRP